jgi:hypothetical protein
LCWSYENIIKSEFSILIINYKESSQKFNKRLMAKTTSQGGQKGKAKKRPKYIICKNKKSSSFKIDLRDVSWWMSIKDACRLGVSVTTRLFLKGCISLAIVGRPSRITLKHD